MPPKTPVGRPSPGRAYDEPSGSLRRRPRPWSQQPLLRRLALLHARHWRRNYLLATGLLLIVSISTFLLANLFNYRDRPPLLPPSVYRELGINHTCTPTWLFYPDYFAVLQLPAPPKLLPELLPPKRTVHRAYKRTVTCWDPSKWSRHPGLSRSDLELVNTLMKDSADKLALGEDYPRVVRESLMTHRDHERRKAERRNDRLTPTEYWNTTVKTSLPSFAPQCRYECGFGEAVSRFWKEMWTPYWRLPKDIKSAAELGGYCPPCSFKRATVSWSRFQRKEELLPPVTHLFWYSNEVQSAAAQSLMWAWLLYWARRDTNFITVDTMRCEMRSTERINGVKDGWFTINVWDFCADREDDEDLAGWREFVDLVKQDEEDLDQWNAHRVRDAGLESPWLRRLWPAG